MSLMIKKWIVAVCLKMLKWFKMDFENGLFEMCFEMCLNMIVYMSFRTFVKHGFKCVLDMFRLTGCLKWAFNRFLHGYLNSCFFTIVLNNLCCF